MSGETMILTLDGGEGAPERKRVPSVMSLCSSCRGRGRVLNPSVARHAFTSDELDMMSHDERDEILAGADGPHGVECRACGGLRVAERPDPSRMTPEQRAFYERWLAHEKAEAAFEAAWAREISRESLMLGERE